MEEKTREGNTWNTSNDFDAIGTSRVDSLRETVTEIRDMVVEREELSENYIQEGDKMKREINNFLLENAPKGEDDSEFSRERSELRKKQMDISEIQLNEKIGCWRDIALLKKELRDREGELSEKENRSKMLSNILND